MLDESLHVPGFVAEPERARLLSLIEAQRARLAPRRSRSGLGPRYDVLDGEMLTRHVPELVRLSEERIVPLLERACGHAVEPLRSARRALRVQVYSKRGDGFRWHRDGHDFAAILTLASDAASCTQIIGAGPSRLLKHVLYPLYVFPNAMSLAPHESVACRAGDLLVLRGRDAIHRGAPMPRDGERIVVVYAYDRRGRPPRIVSDTVARLLNY